MKGSNYMRKGLQLAGLFIIALVLIGMLLIPAANRNLQAVPVAVQPEGTPTQLLVTETPSQPTPVTVFEHDYGAWHVTAQRDSRLSASVTFDGSSTGGLQAYAQANRVLANQLAGSNGQVEIAITFRSLLQPEQYRYWVASHGMTVAVTGLRTHITEWNDRGGLGVRPRAGEVLPEASLNLPNATVQGVLGANGQVPASELPAIAADPLVFIPDVTTTIVRQDLVAAGLPVNEVANASVHQLGSPFWFMENLGLSNFEH